MRHGLHRHRLPARLFWRVYLNGLLLLALVALAMFAVGAALRHAPPGHSQERFVQYAAERVGELHGDPERLARELRRVRETFGAEVTVYERGAVLASNVQPPAAPLSPAEEARVASAPFKVADRHWTFAAAVEGAPGAYVLLSGSLPSPSLLRGATFLAAVLLALAVASISSGARRSSSPTSPTSCERRSRGSGWRSTSRRRATSSGRAAISPRSRPISRS